MKIERTDFRREIGSSLSFGGRTPEKGDEIAVKGGIIAKAALGCDRGGGVPQRDHFFGN
jgi:hypothetical protein